MEKETGPREEGRDLPVIGITPGDFNGIGPEIILKTLSDNRITRLCRVIVYGSGSMMNKYRKLLNLEDVNFNTVTETNRLNPKRPNLINCWTEDYALTIGKSTAEAGLCAFMALDHAARDLKDGVIDALVTAPINKANMPPALFPFPGHTEFLESRFGTEESLMFLVDEGLRIGVATGHIPLHDVAKALTRDRLNLKLDLMYNSLRKDFGIQQPKIALLGLNPHAGEEGKIGNEEMNMMEPLIRTLKDKGRMIFGPYPADGFFGARMQTRFDGILAAYHDQGLIAFKALSFESGVNFTAGLPIVRTSPDHGTAYNIAGKNLANPDSFRAALFLALEVLKARKQGIS
ncbi:MAG: 4-hydroxythreonine-4-phosphate dehydrogenase PdxA [Bacteroidota bacterium]